MAITDAKLYFTDGTQSMPSDDTETISENIIDLSASGFGVGEGRPAYLNVAIETAVENAGANTVTFTVYEHTAATSVTSGNALLSFTRDKSELAAGDVVRVPLPVDTDERYLGLSVTNSAGSGTSGAFYAWIDLG